MDQWSGSEEKSFVYLCKFNGLKSTAAYLPPYQAAKLAISKMHEVPFAPLYIANVYNAVHTLGLITPFFPGGRTGQEQQVA